MAKRKMSENSIKNLELGTKFDANHADIARKAQEKAVIKRAENAQEKIKRENANEYIWDTIGVPTVEEVLTQGTTQQKLDLLKAVLPKDVLEQKLSGSLDIVQPPVINILPVEVRHEDDTDAEAVDVSIKQ